MSQHKDIFVKNAREHNLKGIDLKIPRDKLVVFTGVSGSGKSSLVFDTIYAEGYRKYIDSLSTKARLYLDQIKKPDVDYINGLSPVIAIEQRSGSNSNPRSTVASVTELADYARLLWSVKGVAYSPEDGTKIEKKTVDDCVDQILKEKEDSRMILLAPLEESKSSVLRELFPRLLQKGFQRVRVNGEIGNLDDPDLIPVGQNQVQVELVVDRIVIKPEARSRIADSLEIAFKEGGDRALALIQESKEDEFKTIALSQKLTDASGQFVYNELTPRHFSWNHPEGACPTCSGIGEKLYFVESLIIPDPTLSVKNGAIKAWRIGSKGMIIKRNAILKQLSEQIPFDPKTAWNELPEDIKNIILHGDTSRTYDFKLKAGNSKPVPTYFEGVISDLNLSRRESSSEGFRARLTTYMTGTLCPDCNGDRLNAFSRAVMVEGLNFPQFLGMQLQDAYQFIDEKLNKNSNYLQVGDAIQGLLHRLYFLREVGLGYLTMNRPFNTLSGGEAQRVRLATQLGMGLVGVTYVLDEPSIGLHPIDNRKLIETLKDLRDQGNTVLVVEHDAETMLASDHMIELGPMAGVSGGHVLFEGTPQEACESKKSRSGSFLNNSRTIEKDYRTLKPQGNEILIKGARHNNLKNVTASIPTGLLTVVCGVSGSGKSTLINDILGNAASFQINHSKEIPGLHDQIHGLEYFKRVIRVDQSPIGKSPRSNPATYTKLFDQLRNLFAQCPLAKVRGYKNSRFSFNTVGGRCENCKGDGMIRLDMQFLSDVFVECPSCSGKRYNRETLEVTFKGLNISDVLDLTVDEACTLFRSHSGIIEKLDTLKAVGLDYIQLGQAANTLSGGEAQRIKLSLELSKRQQGNTLYLLDEPTTGLHWIDIQKLMDLLFQLRDAGNTVIIIEHDTDVIKLADWILELGPEGGNTGGHLIYSGNYENFTKCTNSPTAKCL
jgi:excinuclease ABC subunit A